ncbi:hypothetical protein [Leptospira levettii]|uniref:hypothetical protein n=1 Tax=Leptospira levettii TaxID=2023178 RepID=UPI000F62E173|nr:hypothetical protein [Leptospira levettii]TGM24850.1 hypothetical protein EHQ74_15000 [Leptospira levettii]TGM29865.1 hypothetical protein EHQ71_14045 [Leptospira levettii]TGM84757.1 hypothetical protein EHR00_17380 [Leptospira levettii]
MSEKWVRFNGNGWLSFWAPRTSYANQIQFKTDRAIRSNLSLGERISASIAGARGYQKKYRSL